MGRALNDAVLLAPGVAGNGPSGNIMMAGALSFESQYLVNGGYTKRSTAATNNRFGSIMDMASLYDNTTNQYLYTANYTSVIRSNFFEGPSTRRRSRPRWTPDRGSRTW